jgi:hypothetical protein
LEELKQFQSDHGHDANVLPQSDETQQFGQWVNEQRMG